MHSKRCMIRVTAMVVLVWLLFATLPPAMAQNTPVTSDSDMANKPAWCNPVIRRIQFRFGSFRGAASRFLTPTCTQALFVLRARAGQRMRLFLTSAGPAVGTVIFPNGSARGRAVGTRGVFFDGFLPFSGDYIVRINQDARIQFWFGSFSLSALIV